jgi:cysteine-rich repeat protein
VFPPENNCFDGIDNNGDGMTDCADSTCATAVGQMTTCGVGVCAATGNLACSNGQQIDTCRAGVPGVEGPFGDATCTDTVDNDCDGATDGGDPDCIEVVVEEICDDDQDNDGDGLVDCDDTADCANDPACQVVAEICGDGIVDSVEECDDGNNANGDGCSATCIIEPPDPGDSEVRITQAEWEAEKSKLKVRGEGTIGEEVIITNADTGEHLGEAEVDERGKWKLDVFNPTPVPCSILATLGGDQSAEAAREVKNAPGDCRDDDDEHHDDDDDDDDHDGWRAKILKWLGERD